MTRDEMLERIAKELGLSVWYLKDKEKYVDATLTVLKESIEDKSDALLLDIRDIEKDGGDASRWRGQVQALDEVANEIDSLRATGSEGHHE